MVKIKVSTSRKRINNNIKQKKSIKKNNKEIDRLVKLRVLSINKKKKKKSQKPDNLKKKLDLQNKIKESFNNSGELENVSDKIFCDSFEECSRNTLSYIGYYSLAESVKVKIDSSISNFSYLLKYSFLNSLKLAISIFGIMAFSIPSIEKLYTKGKKISQEVLEKVGHVSSKIKNVFIDRISKLKNISPREILSSIKNIILRHKVLLSISTVCLVVFSIQYCRLINSKGGLTKFKDHFSFVDILKSNLNFFPFNTTIGKVIIEYTGMFIDNSREIVNKVIAPINLVCQGKIFSGKQESSESQILNLGKNIEYKPWQLVPIDYMTRKCINNNGIYLYHDMGTGKTISALGIAHNIGLPYLIICPKTIINQWKNDYIRVYKNLPKNIGIISYEQAIDFLEDKKLEWFSNKTLIMDEAHNFVNFMDKIPIRKLMSFRKRITLSATPIYNSLHDFSFIINISAGRNIFPLDPKLFEKSYCKIKTETSLITGWIVSNLENLRKISIASAYFNFVFDIVNFLLTKKFGKSNNLLLKISNNIEKPLNIFLDFISKPVTKLISFMSFEEFISENILFRVVKVFTREILGGSEYAQATINSFKKLLTRDLFILHPKDKSFLEKIDDVQNKFNNIEDIKEKISNYIGGIKKALKIARDTKDFSYFEENMPFIHFKKSSTAEENLASLTEILNLLENFPIPETLYINNFKTFVLMTCKSVLAIKVIIIGVISMIICILLRKIYLKNSGRSSHPERESFFTLDEKKIYLKTSTFTSYYVPSLEDKNYPKLIEKKLDVSLNDKMILVLMRFTLGRMNYQDYMSLGISENYEDCEYLIFDQKRYDLFLKHGRYIGNICYFKNKSTNQYEYNISKVLYYDKIECKCVLKKSFFIETPSTKYEKIKNYHLNNTDKKIVIYTSSSLAAKTLSAYLTNENIINQLLLNDCNSETFNTIINNYYQRKNILIIDSKYYEGVSVLNTDTMFILEATINISHEIQIRGRIRRIDSHPPNSKVEIINLISDMSLVSKYLNSIKVWFKEAKYTFYTHLFTYHNQHITPDTILYNRNRKIMAYNLELTSVLKKSTIENLEDFDSCQSIGCEIDKLTEKNGCSQVNSKILAQENENNEEQES